MPVFSDGGIIIKYYERSGIGSKKYMGKDRKFIDPRVSQPSAWEPSERMPPDEEQFAPPGEEPVLRMGEIVGGIRRYRPENLRGGPKGKQPITDHKRREYLTGWDYGQGAQLVYPDRNDQLPARLAAHTLHAQDFAAIGMDAPDLTIMLDDPNAVASWQTALKTKATKTFWGHLLGTVLRLSFSML